MLGTAYPFCPSCATALVHRSACPSRVCLHAGHHSSLTPRTAGLPLRCRPASVASAPRRISAQPGASVVMHTANPRNPTLDADPRPNLLPPSRRSAPSPVFRPRRTTPARAQEQPHVAIVQTNLQHYVLTYTAWPRLRASASRTLACIIVSDQDYPVIPTDPSTQRIINIRPGRSP